MIHNPKIAEILDKFQEYLKTSDAKKHLDNFSKEKKEVLDLMEHISKMDKKSEEFTEWVLYGLLPQYNTKRAKRISLFPSFQNIRKFFEGFNYGYTEQEWNLIANMIYNLCNDFQKNPDKLAELIENFSKDKYSRRLQIGSISPILFCINDSFPLINNRSRRTYKSIMRIAGKKDMLSQKLNDYMENKTKLEGMVELLDFDLLKNMDYLDIFCYWYDSIILVSEEAEAEEKAEKLSDNGSDTNEKQSEKIDYSEFIEKINLKDLSKFEPHSLRSPERIKIRDIMSHANKGVWVLPHFQRYFDWKKSNIKGFLNSIFKDYYVGAILVWDTDKEPDFGVQPIKGVYLTDTPRPDAIILDGQQRITSLYYAIKAPHVKGFEDGANWSNTEIYKEHPLYFYINFNKFLSNSNDDELIEAYHKKFSNEECFGRFLFPLYELEKYSEWVFEFEKFLRQHTTNHDKVYSIKEIVWKKLNHMWEHFEIPYIALPKTMDIDKVAEIFEGINSTGKPLTVFDLLIARLYKYNQSLKDLWDNTRKDFPKIDAYSKSISKMPNYILQTISLLYEANSSAKKEDILNIYANIYLKSDRDFEDDWNEISEYMNRAIMKLENMKDGFGVKDVKELPFAPTIPIMTALLKTIEGKNNKIKCYKKLQQWYWSVIFTNAYSQSVDSQITSDFKEMTKWFDDDNEIPKKVIQMHREFPNLYLRDIKQQSNAQYRGIMSLIALHGAKDFETGQTLENARGNDKDHIFPKSVKSGFAGRKNINSVLNMTWLSDQTNRRKSDKKPSSYITNFIKEKYEGDEKAFLKILESHLIDRRAYDSLLSDNFEEFLNYREEIILKKIQELVGLEDFSIDRKLISSDTPFSNKMVYTHTLKSCKEYLHWVDKYFSQMGLDIISQTIDAVDIKEIKILMANEKADEKFKDLFKDFKKEMSHKGIECECRVMTDSKIKASIHDRFLITKHYAYNMPSPDIMARGQLSEITESNNRDELKKQFRELWDKSKDIIHEWNSIKE